MKPDGAPLLRRNLFGVNQEATVCLSAGQIRQSDGCSGGSVSSLRQPLNTLGVRSAQRDQHP